MLTLDPSSYCDVCCESFSSLPHCIDCGHIFCSKCLDAICEKTWSPRQLPSCPFCREPFTKESVRKVRVELKTPRPQSKEIEIEDDGSLAGPSEAKRLEDRVAKAAASKCSFEEVSELHKEIQQWLASEVKRPSAGHHASLQLSAALLRAILLNCLSYSEANKVAKSVETSLKERLEHATSARDRLEGELSKHRAMYTQKVRECQDLRSEVNRLKLTITVPSSGGARAVSAGIPSRRPTSPAPLSRTHSTFSATTASSQATPRPSNITRPATTAPITSFSSGFGSGRGLVVGSAPTSNTMASAMKLQTPYVKARSVSSWSVTPPSEGEKAPERWIPASDDESVSSDKWFPLRSSPADQTFSGSSSHHKWMPHLQLPPVAF